MCVSMHMQSIAYLVHGLVSTQTNFLFSLRSASQKNSPNTKRHLCHQQPRATSAFAWLWITCGKFVNRTKNRNPQIGHSKAGKLKPLSSQKDEEENWVAKTQPKRVRSLFALSQISIAKRPAIVVGMHTRALLHICWMFYAAKPPFSRRLSSALIRLSSAHYSLAHTQTRFRSRRTENSFAHAMSYSSRSLRFLALSILAFSIDCFYQWANGWLTSSCLNSIANRTKSVRLAVIHHCAFHAFDYIFQ